MGDALTGSMQISHMDSNILSMLIFLPHMLWKGGNVSKASADHEDEIHICVDWLCYSFCGDTYSHRQTSQSFFSTRMKLEFTDSHIAPLSLQGANKWGSL